MQNIEQILTKIAGNADCTIAKLNHPLDHLPVVVPEDLAYYLKNYAAVELFHQAPYTIKIVGLSEFKRANPIIVGEDVPDDISHHWYIIASDNNSQYITVDLTKGKLGYCYDSFWDRHGVVGEQAVIAKSFTELLERLYQSKGQTWYWTEPAFQSYGDAYDIIR